MYFLIFSGILYLGDVGSASPFSPNLRSSFKGSFKLGSARGKDFGSGRNAAVIVPLLEMQKKVSSEIALTGERGFTFSNFFHYFLSFT